MTKDATTHIVCINTKKCYHAYHYATRLRDIDIMNECSRHWCLMDSRPKL